MPVHCAAGWVADDSSGVIQGVDQRIGTIQKASHAATADRSDAVGIERPATLPRPRTTSVAVDRRLLVVSWLVASEFAFRTRRRSWRWRGPRSSARMFAPRCGASHLIGHHGSAAPAPRRGPFNRRVQCQQVGLKGDLVNSPDNSGGLFAAFEISSIDAFSLVIESLASVTVAFISLMSALAWLAFSALCPVREDISSSVAEISSIAAACCEAPSATLWLVAEIGWRRSPPAQPRTTARQLPPLAVS